MRFIKANLQRKPAQAHGLRRCIRRRSCRSLLMSVPKCRQAKARGYARWAKVFNLKQMAKAMMFMEEHGIKSYAELKEKADGISEKCDALLESVKADEERMSEVSVLRKHLSIMPRQKMFLLRISIWLQSRVL